MQEKKDQPGQSDMGGEKKQWPGDEAGKQGGQGDVGKKRGAPVENPNVEGPTDRPDKGGDVRQPPA